ncbi:MAG: diphthine--ammonia ligase [Bacteroidota bacterium]
MKLALSWSGGKDSAFALYKLLQNSEYEVVKLFTVFDQETEEVNLHGIHHKLIEKQVKTLGVPLEKVFTSPEDYNKNLVQLFRKLKEMGIEYIAFGDVFLEDLKSFRDQMLEKTGLKGIYPLWNMNSQDVLRDFLNAGFKSKICAADSKYFSKSEIGEDLSIEILKNKDVDLCGENGEYHSFVYDGPIFKKKLDPILDEAYYRKYQFKIKTDEGIKEQDAKYWFGRWNVRG